MLGPVTSIIAANSWVSLAGTRNWRCDNHFVCRSNLAPVQIRPAPHTEEVHASFMQRHGMGDLPRTRATNAGVSLAAASSIMEA